MFPGCFIRFHGIFRGVSRDFKGNSWGGLGEFQESSVVCKGYQRVSWGIWWRFKEFRRSAYESFLEDFKGFQRLQGSFTGIL